jgi:hypothetical protein
MGAKASGDLSTKDTLDHAWNYFVLHAGQRMSLFNFFLVLAGLVAAGLAACIQQSGPLQLLGAALGLLLTLVSFIFWKLDQRVSFLLKHAENAIANIESSIPVSVGRLVSSEVTQTSAAHAKGFILFRMWTYGTAFRAVFLVMGTVGMGGGTLCILRYVTRG